jgi:hypothetical protein
VVGRVTNVEMTFFIAMQGGSRAVRGWWLMAVVWIQYFDFVLRGEAKG